ncbi:MAG: AAA family ATPase [Eggerthellaceae bacterium]
MEGHPGLVSLFVSAPMEARVARVVRRNNLSESDARSRIARVDKNRASYYRYFTDENWGRRETTTCASTPATWTRWERSL